MVGGRLEQAMQAAAKWMSFVFVGGIALGCALGAAADPRIKDPPPQWWQLTGNDTSTSPSNEVYADYGTYALDVHGGYRPDLDYEAEVWSLPLPDLDYAYYGTHDAAPPVAETGPQLADAEAAADAAAIAANEAADAAQADLAPIDVRKAEIALNGIY